MSRQYDKALANREIIGFPGGLTEIEIFTEFEKKGFMPILFDSVESNETIFFVNFGREVFVTLLYEDILITLADIPDKGERLFETFFVSIGVITITPVMSVTHDLLLLPLSENDFPVFDKFANGATDLILRKPPDNADVIDIAVIIVRDFVRDNRRTCQRAHLFRENPSPTVLEEVFEEFAKDFIGTAREFPGREFQSFFYKKLLSHLGKSDNQLMRVLFQSYIRAGFHFLLLFSLVCYRSGVQKTKRKIKNFEKFTIGVALF